MVISINDASEIPIYQQIRNQIVLGISDGRLAPGEQLPTVRALAEEIGINSMTVSKAYTLLKQEGTIYTAAPKQGCIGGIDNRICFRLYNITFYNRQTFHFAIPLCQIPLSHHFILFLKIRKAIFQKKLSNSYIFAHFSQKNKPNPKFGLFCFHSAVFIFSIGFCGSPFFSMAKIRCSPSATPYFVGAATVPIRCPCFTLSPSLTATASAS